MLKDGGQCDWSVFVEDAKCDPFVQIFINGNLKYKSKVTSNSNAAVINEKYRSPKIPKDAKITFEVRDDDIVGSDLLLSKTLSIDELTKDSSVGFIFVDLSHPF